MADVRASTSRELRELLSRMVAEGILDLGSSMTPSSRERERQVATAKAAADSASARTARTTRTSAVADKSEAEDDVFAASKKKGPPEDSGEKVSDVKHASNHDGDSGKRKNRNSPEAAQFSLADAQRRAKDKEKKSASVVPTPKPSDLSFDMVTTALNIMRSGQSLKDERVSAEVQKYYNSLNAAERVALYSYLNGLAQILSANVPSERAPDPGDVPNPISMEFQQGEPKADRDRGSSDKHSTQDDSRDGNRTRSKPGVERHNSKEDDGPEDTTPPIRVGRRGDG